MVLWKRESNSHDACYVNLLTEIEQEHFDNQFDKLTFQGTSKADDKSIEWRHHGNEQFKALNWHKAMESYNQSLRYATDGSENISLAYANRSACFLHMQFYAECLVDIELAKAANYPQRLMHKLTEREAKCLELMAKNTQRNRIKEVALSYAPNNDFPCLANVLDIRRNDEFGKHIVANCDIDVGQIILIEDAFAHGILETNQTLCETCLKSVKNFIPCPNCAEQMFCGVDCIESSSIHKLMCGMSGISFNQNWEMAIIVIKSVLLAATAFPNVECLMTFVESALSTRDFHTPECNSDAQAKYRMFLKLFALTEELDEAIKWELTLTHRLVLKIPEMEQRFNSKQAKRFLMHLIWQHLCILQTNSFSFDIKNVETGVLQDISIAANFISLFNHSCYPNAMNERQNNKVFVYTMRPVKKDEQLFINYKSMPASAKMEFQRTGLGEHLQFQCKCSKCIPQCKRADRMQILSDTDFLFLLQIDESYSNDPDKRSTLKDKALKLLKRYGRLPWSTEIESVMNIFDNTFSTDYTDMFKI